MEGPPDICIPELRGIPPEKRRPFRSKSMQAAARIYAAYHTNNPFANFPSSAQRPDVPGNGSRPRSEKKTPGERIGPATGKDDIGGEKERKDDIGAEKERKDLEVKRSIFEGNSASHAQVSAGREISNSSVAADQFITEDVGGKQKSFNEKVQPDLSQIGFSAQRSENEGGTVSVSGSTINVNSKKGKKNVKPRRKKHISANNGGSARGLAEGEGLKGSEMISDSVDKLATSNYSGEVQEDLLGIERSLIDNFDDLSLLQLPDEDFNFDICNDFGSFFNTDVVINDSVPVESKGSGELHIEGNIREDIGGEKESKDDIGGEKERKDVEVKRSNFEGNVTSHAQVAVGREISNSSVAADQFITEDAGGKQKTCKEKVQPDLSQIGFSAQWSENEGGTVSISGSTINVKSKMGKKDVKPRRRKHISAKVEASKCTTSGVFDPLFHGKMLNQNVLGQGNSSTGQVANCLESREIIKYSREKLLNLQPMAAVPEDILKAVKESCAELLGEDQTSAARESVGSDVLKDKKRGSSSAAKKEKKKKKKRQKRAQMNMKLGVKRLKLRPPILKPKVVPHCRHYLKGRCQEGDKCKFSHDVVPLTKSQPCCHFARQACMKGDDCPYDHQLSKYPCNNYVTTGFCVRGDNCLFSHKIEDKKDSEPTIGISKEIKSLDQLGKSNTKHLLDAFVFSSSGIAENSGKTRQPAKAPKGLSFLSFGKWPPDNSAKNKEADSSQLSRDGVGTGGSFPFLGGPSYDNFGDKLQTVFSTNGQSDSQICMREEGNASESGKFNAIQPKVWGSPTPGQRSAEVGGPRKSTSSKAQRALSSTLAFAAKYESGIKKCSAAATSKEVNKNEATGSDSGCRLNEPSKASAIFEFLSSRENKQKQ